MGRRKSLSPTSVVTATTTTLLRLPRLVLADGTLDHLRSLRVDYMVDASTPLLQAHVTILLGHLLVNA